MTATPLMKSALVVSGLSLLVFFILALTLTVALVTGLVVDHGQALPGGYTVPGLVSIGGMLLGAVMAGVDLLTRRVSMR